MPKRRAQARRLASEEHTDKSEAVVILELSKVLDPKGLGGE